MASSADDRRGLRVERHYDPPGHVVWREGAAINHPDGRESGRPRILFQLVPEAKTVKNRVHLDVRVGEDKVEAEVERLVGKGGTFLHRGRQGPHQWVTLADPEGNEFCVVRPKTTLVS